MENAIKFIRKKFKLTQDELAEKLSVSRELVNKMEGGKTPISHKNIYKIKELFDFDVNNLSHQNIDVEVDINKSISYLYETVISQQAELNVLRVIVDNLAADVKGISVSLVSGDTKKAIKEEKDRLFDEFLNKRK
ncbi:MAG: helix-turn-helix transcriptional regulator [Chitinophagaceae bacterium]|nr:helix-turn-helix transcriptional regulator [Chitinophagaceae bacterium]